MEKQLGVLYQSVILQHNKTPHNFKKATELPQNIEAYNPLCGDHFQVYFELEGDVVKQAYFHGYGCAISKASTSILLQQIEGKTLKEIQPIINQFIDIVNGTTSTPIPEEFKAFAAAKNFPSREQCATLSWDSFQDFLKDQL